jgi:hypothetical protein
MITDHPKDFVFKGTSVKKVGRDGWENGTIYGGGQLSVTRISNILRTGSIRLMTLVLYLELQIVSLRWSIIIVLVLE